MVTLVRLIVTNHVEWENRLQWYLFPINEMIEMIEKRTKAKTGSLTCFSYIRFTFHYVQSWKGYFLIGYSTVRDTNWQVYCHWDLAA